MFLRTSCSSQHPACNVKDTGAALQNLQGTKTGRGGLRAMVKVDLTGLSSDLNMRGKCCGEDILKIIQTWESNSLYSRGKK